MIDFKEFAYKVPRVLAVRMTQGNISEIAETFGLIRSSESVIQVGRSEKEPIPASVGDWIVAEVPGEIYAYSDEEFRRLFRTPSEARKYQAFFSPEVSARNARIHQLVREAMLKQDTATYYGESSAGMDIVAKGITERIINLI